MNSSFTSISPQDVYRRLKEGAQVRLVDVRTAAEYADGHAMTAVSLPVDQLDAATLAERFGHASADREPVYLICASGQRAQVAAEKLHAQGMTDVAWVAGGTDAWAAQRLPMKRTSRVLSLERQTQIAVGVLLLLALAKGTLLHPAFLTLIALMGIGLVFSGVTARCGMAALLARMPWNRPTAAAPAQAG